MITTLWLAVMVLFWVTYLQRLMIQEITEDVKQLKINSDVVGHKLNLGGKPLRENL